LPGLDFSTKLDQPVKLFDELKDRESTSGRVTGIPFYMVFKLVLGPKQRIFNS